MDGVKHVESTGEITPSLTFDAVEDQATIRRAGIGTPASLTDDSSLEARLNSAGTNVVCGAKYCGSRMAAVSNPSDEEIAEAEKNGVWMTDCLQFLPGWVPGSDGAWRFSEYARKRRQEGKSVKLRRYPANQGLGFNSVMDRYYDDLPVLARCERCDLVNLLTSEKLGVTRVLRIPARLGIA